MEKCDFCGYYYSDCDKYVFPQGNDYCHYMGPDKYAPCKQDDEMEVTKC